MCWKRRSKNSAWHCIYFEYTQQYGKRMWPSTYRDTWWSKRHWDWAIAKQQRTASIMMNRSSKGYDAKQGNPNQSICNTHKRYEAHKIYSKSKKSTKRWSNENIYANWTKDTGEIAGDAKVWWGSKLWDRQWFTQQIVKHGKKEKSHNPKGCASTVLFWWCIGN